LIDRLTDCSNDSYMRWLTLSKLRLHTNQISTEHRALSAVSARTIATIGWRRAKLV